MAGNTRFHNKHHAAQHHSVIVDSESGYPDTATDPIASKEAKYNGPFYINGIIDVRNDLPTIGTVDYSTYINQFANPMRVNYDQSSTLGLSVSGNAEISGNLHVKENLYVDKNVYLSGGDGGVLSFGDAEIDRVRFDAHVDTDIIPAGDQIRDLGRDSKRWNKLWAYSIDLAGDLVIKNGNACVLNVSVSGEQVMIGTCSTDPGNRLNVVGGTTVLEGAGTNTALSVVGPSTFSQDIFASNDIHLVDNKKLVLGSESNNNYITSSSNKVTVNGNDSILIKSLSSIDIDTPVVSVEQETTLDLGPNDLTVKSDGRDCMLHFDSSLNRVGVGTCSPSAGIEIGGSNGDTLISGTRMGVDVAEANITTSQTDINAVHLNVNTPGGYTKITGDEIHLTGGSNPTTGEVPVKISGKVVDLTASSHLDINSSTIDLQTQSTHISLKNATNALKVDGDTLVIDSSNNRVGINKSGPSKTLHVGGTMQIDGSTSITTGDLDINNDSVTITTTGDTDITSPNIHLAGTTQVEIDAPVLNLDTPEVDLSTQNTVFSIRKAVNSLKFVGKTTTPSSQGSSLHASSTSSTSLISMDGVNNRIGILTDDPDHSLTVLGTVAVTGSVTNINSDSIIHTGTTGAYSHTTSADITSPTITLGSTDTVLNSTGKVYLDTPIIDTTSRTVNIDVKDVVNALSIESDIISIDGLNKRLGIGTTTPGSDLHVTVDTHIESPNTVDIDSDVVSISSVSKTDVSSNDTVSILGSVVEIDGTTSIDVDTPKIDLEQRTAITLPLGTDQLNIDDGTISVNSFDNSVGINTTTPTDTFTVVTPLAPSNDPFQGINVRTKGDDKDGVRVLADTEQGQIEVYNDGNKTVSILGSGDSYITGGAVGIGIVAPGEALEVNGNIRTTSTNNSISLGSPSTGPYIQGDNSNSLYLGTSGTAKAVILSGGEVGIGIMSSNAGSKLTVSGNTHSDTYTGSEIIITDAQVSTLAANRLIYVDPSNSRLSTNDTLYCNPTGGANGIGQVGINTTTPNALAGLHIGDGDLRISGPSATAIFDPQYSLAGGLVNGTTDTATALVGGEGQHVVLDLRNDSDADCIAFRHSSNNNPSNIDTVSFLYKPTGDTAQVGINVATTNMNGTDSFVVGGNTHLQGDLKVDGNFLIQGTEAQLEIQNLEITDKSVVVNKGGSTNDSGGSGIIIKGDNNADIGYVKIHESNISNLLIKAPTGNELTLDINDDVILTIDSNLTVSGPSIINQDVSTIGDVLFNSISLTSKLINNVDIELVRSELTAVMAQADDIQAELDVTQASAGLSTTGEYVAQSYREYIPGATSLDNADELLDFALKSEEQTRIAIDSSLQQQLDAEIATREALQAEVDVTQSNIGISPAGTYTANNSANYIDTSTTIVDATEDLDSALKVEETTRIQVDTDIQNELDVTQVGAGLATTGAYVPYSITNYLNVANSLHDADKILDTNIKTLENLIGHGGSPHTSNHKTRLDGHDSDINVLDNRVTDNTTFIEAVSASLDERVDLDVDNNRVVATDNSGKITSTDLTSWISGTSNQIAVTTDTSGGVVLSLPHGDFTSNSAASVGTLKLNDASVTSDRLLFVDGNDTLQTVNDLSTWIEGTNNQISINNPDNDGTITLSLEQNINTGASPTFENINLTNLTKNKFVTVNDDGSMSTVSLDDWIVEGPGIDIAANGIDNTGVEISHQDTSSQASVLNSALADAQQGFRKVIQNIEVDTFGHITNLETADVSYGLATTSSTGVVPVLPGTANSAETFLNGENNWVVYPDIVGRIASGHPSIIVNSNNAYDTITVGISNTLTIGTDSTTVPSPGLVHVLGNETDTAYTVFKGERRDPRIELKDTTQNTGKNFHIHSKDGYLLIGSTNQMLQDSTCALKIGAGEKGLVEINGTTKGHGGFVGDLTGTADIAKKLDGDRNIHFSGDITGAVATDLSDGFTVDNMKVNKVQPSAVNLVTDTTGPFVKSVNIAQDPNLELVADLAPRTGSGEGQVIAIKTRSNVSFGQVTANKFKTNSDIAFKKNVTLIPDALEKVASLTGVLFDWKSDNTTQAGLVANEVESVIPTVVDTDEDTGMKSIEYTGIISYLVEAIKSLKDEVDSLKKGH